jgi:hypothetical protein
MACPRDLRAVVSTHDGGDGVREKSLLRPDPIESLRGDLSTPAASAQDDGNLDAKIWNRYRLRFREAVRGPSA